MSETELGREVSSGIARDTAMVTLCTLVSRITGFGRVVAIAAVLGSGLLADVYQTANMMPNLLFELVAGGILQAVLLPVLVEARREGGDAALSAATRATTGVILAGLGIVAAVGIVVSPIVARIFVLSEPSAAIAAEKVDVMVPMVILFMPQLLCYGVATVTSAALNARGRFVAAALAPAVNNLIVIGACLAFRASRHGKAADLHLSPVQFMLIVGGTTLGVLVFSFTPAVALRRQGVRWAPTWDPQSAAVRSMRRSFGWATLSIVGTLVPTAAALVLGNGAPGGVAVFMYAFAFYVLPHALVAVTIATTLAPRVADAWQDGRTDEVRSKVNASLHIAVPLLALGGAGMIALAWPLTRVMAGFGQTASQGLAPIAHALIAFGPGLIGYGVSFVMVRVLFALDDVRKAALMTIGGAVVGVVCMVVASAVLTPGDRAAALAIGYGASQSITAVLLVRRVHRLTGAMSASRAARLLIESFVAAGAAIAAMLAVISRFDPTRRQALPAFLLGGAAGVAAFAAVMTLRRGGDLRRGGSPAR